MAIVLRAIPAIYRAGRYAIRTSDYPLRVPEAIVFLERLFMRLIKDSLAGLALTGILAMMPVSGLMSQTTVHIVQAPVGRVQVPRVQLNLTPQRPANPSNVRIAGFPSGPTQLPYPLISTPANDAWAQNNAWAAYNANLRHIPTAENPNRLAARQKRLDQDRFIQRPQSSGRYNFQFSDNELRSV